MTVTAGTAAAGSGAAREDGYAAQAIRGLTYLGRLFGAEAGFDTAARDAVEALFAGWGHRTTRGIDEPEAARGRAPFEFSLVMKDSGPEIRIFLRPLSGEGPTTADSSWQAGWRAVHALEEQGVASLARARTVRDLFVPRSDRAAFGLCIAATVRPTGVAGVKMYFDTLAAGTAENRRVIGEAMERLGLGDAWQWLRRQDPEGMACLMPAFFALDLDDSPQARIKFYTTVDERSADALRARLGRLSGTAGRSAAGLLHALSAGGPAALAAPGVRPTLCWNLTQGERQRPGDATLYLPFQRYTPSGDEALDRLRPYVRAEQLTRLDRFLAHCAADGAHDRAERQLPNPFHWAAAKVNREVVGPLTLYVSAAVVDGASRAES
ncbi:tryptophan dimethylallyltransferase family protein [Streptomyces sp. NPDC053069]|uniref:tryptophan dimethylallyltransferase family protein n=1 Tax=Streptomyces sp. NPDC053069 TaxID=3365695 RepID=UPI0037D650C2